MKTYSQDSEQGVKRALYESEVRHMGGKKREKQTNHTLFFIGPPSFEEGVLHETGASSSTDRKKN